MDARVPLTRSAIVATGRRLAQEHGAGALSMRRVATELHCSPMALYRHVADKRELLVLVLEDVAEGLPLAVPLGSPGERVVGLFEQVHDYLSGYPWVVDVLREGELYAPRALLFVEAVLEAFAEAGVTGHEALVAYTALWHYTVGHLASVHPTDPAIRAVREELARRAPMERLPRVAALMPVVAAFHPEDAFRIGLQALVRGLLPAS